MTCSTGALGSSFSMANTTFCDGAYANPNMVRAATASSCICVLAMVDMPQKFPYVLPAAMVPVLILSFRSTITRCAVFSPMPFTAFSILAFSVLITFTSSAGERAESIIRAVLPPMPDTEINSKNSSRSCLSTNP